MIGREGGTSFLNDLNQSKTGVRRNRKTINDGTF